MAADRAARRLALAVHRWIARSSRATRLYCRALASLRFLLPESVAGRLANNLSGVVWPSVRLPPARVRLGASTDVLLHPHLGEFDAEALVRRVLTYETAVFRWLEPRIASYDVIIEIGANVGIFTVFFSRIVRAAGVSQSRIIAFEPSREAFGRLLENLAVNDARDVIALNAAVGGCSGIGDFFEPRGHLTNGSLVPAFAAQFARDVTTTPVVCLDGGAIATLVPQGSRVLLKIDVEGAEATVLTSLRQLILQHRPDMILEVLPGYEDGIVQAIPMESRRVSFHQLTPEGPMQRLELKATHSDRDWWIRLES